MILSFAPDTARFDSVCLNSDGDKASAGNAGGPRGCRIQSPDHRTHLSRCGRSRIRRHGKLYSGRFERANRSATAAVRPQNSQERFSVWHSLPFW